MHHLLASQTLWLKHCNLEMCPGVWMAPKEATYSPRPTRTPRPTKTPMPTNSPRPITKKDEKKVVPTTKDSPTKEKLKKEEKNYGRRQTRFYERTPREPIIEWEKRILAREARVREKNAIICARFECKSGVLLNHPYVAMSSPPKAQKGCRRRANPRNGEETVEASDAPHTLRKGKRRNGDAKGDAHSDSVPEDEEDSLPSEIVKRVANGMIKL